MSDQQRTSPPVVERSISPVASKRGGYSRTAGAVVAVGVASLAIGWVFLHPTHKAPEKADDRLRVQSTARYEPAPAPLPMPTQQIIFRPPQSALPMAQVEQQQQAATATTGQAPPADPMKAARHASLLAYGSPGTASGRAQGGQGGAVRPDGTRVPTELAGKLVPTQATAVTASVLQNQPYLLTRGTQIQCALLTAIDSTLPGPISCKLPIDVIGKTGLTLLDRGTIITGETGGSMAQGQNRLFALWSRAETPQGVIINLDSPAADPLGRSGMEGDVDTHFLARIGNALLLSVVQGALQAGVAAASAQGATNINLGGTESAVAEALRGSVNIRPTLRMNQGDLVAVSVIRDLDFKGVYRIDVQ